MPNITLTNVVTEYTLEIDPTIIRDGHIFVDGTWEQSRAYEVTGASVRVGLTGAPIVTLTGYELNTNDTRRRNKKNMDPQPVWVPTLYIITYTRGKDGALTSTFDSSAYENLVGEVIEDITEYTEA